MGSVLCICSKSFLSGIPKGNFQLQDFHLNEYLEIQESTKVILGQLEQVTQVLLKLVL